MRKKDGWERGEEGRKIKEKNLNEMTAYANPRVSRVLELDLVSHMPGETGDCMN